MLTLDEAMEFITGEGKGLDEMLKCQARIDDTAARYREMLDEVRENHRFQSMVRLWLELGTDDPISSLFSAFMSGLIVGCEMTKPTDG